MAFRKRTFRRRPFRRGPPLARKRRTWIETVVVDPCNPLVVPFCPVDDGCCTTRWNQVVVDNAVLDQQFSDRATVRRILGNLQIWADPNIEAAPLPADQYARVAALYGSLFVQLLVRPTSAAGQAQLPPDIWDTTSSLSGYSESKAKKTWWHHWWSNDRFHLVEGASSAAGQMPVWKPALKDCVTGLVNQCITRDALTAGDGYTWNYTVPGGIELTGDCGGCEGLAWQGQNNEGKLDFPRVWNFSFDVRKRIPLREDETLILDFQGRMPFSQFYDDGRFQVLGGAIKTLLEF